MSILRDVFRRKARSVLTISGIGIGVFALVVLGAVAENQNAYVGKLVGYYENVITVIEEEDANFVGMSSGDRPLSMQKVDELRDYPGVRAVYPTVAVLFDDEYMSVIPPMVLGQGAEYAEYERDMTLSAGRRFGPDERSVAVLGPDLAKQLDSGVGDIIDVRGEPFEVVGVLDRTYVNLTDSSVYVPLADAQSLYFASLPEAFQASVAPEDLVTQVSVSVEPGRDPDEIAEAMNRSIEGILATGPKKMMSTVDGLVGLINAIVGSIAALALVVGGLSIVNTMTMAVAERTREMGVKRALGASRWRIARDVLAESAVMGALGGIGGLAVGTATALALNSAMVAATGTSVLLVTGRLAAGALVFAVVLGAIGGLYPAKYASRMDPAAALAYE